MTSCLPIKIDDLLNPNIVESARKEFKASWNEFVQEQVLQTICAFANDIYNVNGGYIIIGVEETNSCPVRPVKGLSPSTIGGIQTWIRGNSNRLDPHYMPILSPESIDGRQVLVIWVPASDIRPHQAPISLKAGERTYYVRPGSDSIVAKGVLLTDLLNLSNKVPFDDRLNRGFSVSDIRAGLVREFLANVGSGLLSETSEQTVYTQMRLIQPINSHEAPRNVALLFFSENPEKSFQGARIEVVHFVDETGGSVLEEKIFRGPLDRQIRDCLSYLGNLSSLHLRKSDAVFETAGYVGFPLSSLKEAVVNAVYHRGYDNPEPTKIYLYPDRLEIISYPGPVSGLKPEFLLSGAKVPPFPSRNRRIGEFLKELRLAEARGTGLPTIFRTMASNGSPLPTFDFDDDRTYFRATLPAHPEYVALAALRESAQLDATGNPEKALERLESAHQKLPGSGSLTAKLIEAYCAHEKFSKARAVYESFRTQTPRTSEAKVVATLSRCYLSAGLEREAREVLEHLKLVSSAHDAIELAILEQGAKTKRTDSFNELKAATRCYPIRKPFMSLLSAN